MLYHRLLGSTSNLSKLIVGQSLVSYGVSIGENIIPTFIIFSPKASEELFLDQMFGDSYIRCLPA